MRHWTASLGSIPAGHVNIFLFCYLLQLYVINNIYPVVPSIMSFECSDVMNEIFVENLFLYTILK